MFAIKKIFSRFIRVFSGGRVLSRFFPLLKTFFMTGRFYLAFETLLLSLILFTVCNANRNCPSSTEFLVLSCHECNLAIFFGLFWLVLYCPYMFLRIGICRVFFIKLGSYSCYLVFHTWYILPSASIWLLVWVICTPIQLLYER